LTAVELMC